jgi:hypothetical protein
MAISDAEWNQATDPYILATAITIGTITEHNSGNANTWWLDFDATGLLNVVVDDPDIQEIVLKEVASPFREVAVAEFWIAENEFSGTSGDELFNYTIIGQSGNARAWGFFQLIGANGDNCECNLGGAIDGGGDNAKLTFRSAYAWEKKDPAQLIMALAFHYPDWDDHDPRDVTDKDSFQDASDTWYPYGTLSLGTGYPMSCYREVGLSVKDQIEKIAKQTVDWVAIRPNASTGDVALHYIRRHIANVVDTTVDLDSGSGVSKWSGGIKSRYEVDMLELRYGAYIQRIPTGSGDVIIDNHDDKPAVYQFPMELRSEEEVLQMRRRSDGEKTVIDLPNVLGRNLIMRHWDVGWWGEPQHDITWTQDARHYNFEVGDVVPVTCAALNLSATKFVIYEKTVDRKTHVGTVKALQVLGFSGTFPAHISQADVEDWYKVDNINHMQHNSRLFYPKTGSEASFPKAKDSTWWRSTHNLLVGTEPSSFIDRNGTNETWQYKRASSDTALRRGWPAVSLNTQTVDTNPALSGLKDIILMAVLRPSLAGTFLSDDLVSGGPIDFTCYRTTGVFEVGIVINGTNYGFNAADFITIGTWYLLIWATGSSGFVRINGVESSTFSTSTPNWNGDHRYGISANTGMQDIAAYVNEFLLLDRSTPSADWQGIESYLLEKYALA